ncbi:MAG TPA: hypothetical protein VFH70_02510 [Acidimicrobiales bacterium]|nr:hypothetical protein [Acidimicrobiales bacterium]
MSERVRKRPWWLDPRATIPVDPNRPWYARTPVVVRAAVMSVVLVLPALAVVSYLANGVGAVVGLLVAVVLTSAGPLLYGWQRRRHRGDVAD